MTNKFKKRNKKIEVLFENYLASISWEDRQKVLDIINSD